MASSPLGELVKCTGLKARTIQFWTSERILLCEQETRHGGPGVSRLYPEGEIAIALILSQVTRVPLQLRAVKEIADRLREIINFGPTVGVTDPMWWDSSDDGTYAMYDKMKKVEQEVKDLRQKGLASNEACWEKSQEHTELARQFNGLRDWAPMQIAIQSLQREHWAGGRRQYDPKSDRMLELTVDDADRWQLKLEHADLYMGGSSTDEGPVPVWQIRFLLNLDRLFSRLPGRAAEPAVPSDDTEDTEDGA